MRALPPLAVLVVGIAGCAGDGVIDPGGIGPPPAGTTLTEVQAQVFDQSCAFDFCHGGATPQQGMNLENGLAFGSIVGIPSQELPQFLRIEPGNAADSYLVMKITGDPRIAGERMPFGGPFLSTDQILMVVDWVERGAPDD